MVFCLDTERGVLSFVDGDYGILDWMMWQSRPLTLISQGPGCTSRFAPMAEGDRQNLILNGSCVSIAVRLKRPTTSISTGPFQIQHVIYKTVTAPAIQ